MLRSLSHDHSPMKEGGAYLCAKCESPLTMAAEFFDTLHPMQEGLHTLKEVIVAQLLVKGPKKRILPACLFFKVFILMNISDQQQGAIWGQMRQLVSEKRVG